MNFPDRVLAPFPSSRKLREGTAVAIELNADASSKGDDRFEIVFSPQAVTATSKHTVDFKTSIVPNPNNGSKMSLLLSNAGSAETNVIITDMLAKYY